MRTRAVQFFFFTMLLFAPLVPAPADVSVGQQYSFNFVDVDGNTLSIGDGHVTLLVLATNANLPKARMVGDRVPAYCLANPTYRMITLVKFDNQIALVRPVIAMMARRRLDAEAEAFKPVTTTEKFGAMPAVMFSRSWISTAAPFPS